MNYVIIAGASIENLGAESMTCIAIEKARQMIPDCTIVLASTDRKGMQAKIQYSVMPYRFPTVTKWHRKELFGCLVKKYLGDIIDQHYEKILINTKLIIDISGYAFTTKFKLSSIYSYLNRIFLAKKLNIPYLIFSQSFGPIRIENKYERYITYYYIKKILKYAKSIEAREKVGYEMLQKFSNKNLMHKPDIVLLHAKKINYSILRKNIYLSTKIEERINKVAIIPNEKIIEKTGNGKLYLQILNESIDFLQINNYKVYIIVHCQLDKKLCENIISNFETNIEYIDCTQNGSAMFDSIIKNFNFIIASRYHSIVHGYRHNIPALVMGWEEKYSELLDIMKQTEYGIDCREKIDKKTVFSKLELLIKNEKKERKIIEKTLLELRRVYEEY